MKLSRSVYIILAAALLIFAGLFVYAQIIINNTKPVVAAPDADFKSCTKNEECVAVEHASGCLSAAHKDFAQEAAAQCAEKCAGIVDCPHLPVFTAEAAPACVHNTCKLVIPD